MVVGHFGIAQFGKAARRDLPLPWLLVAAYLPDLVRAVLPLVTSRDEILSHSIPAVLSFALAIGAAWMLRGGRAGAAIALAIVCLLHWPADVFTGCKPTTLHGPWLGLVSYRRPVSDMLVEGALLVGGWVLLRRLGRPLSRWWLIAGFAAQVGFLVATYWGSEFFIGGREWMWRPNESLLPTPHVLETTVCRAKPFGAR